MLHLLGNLRKLVSLRKVHIDGNVFRLYTSATVALLLAFCMLLTAKEYVGSPIDCYCPTLPKSVVDSFCWIESTFSFKSLFNLSKREEVVYPGAGHSKLGLEDRKHHVYYQWVCFLLFCQALSFYFPRWLWKAWEGGKVPALVSSLDVKSSMLRDRGDMQTLLVDFLVLNLHRNNWYFARYLCCELLCVLNVVVQVALTDLVLGGGFLVYGADVVRWQRQVRPELVSPMVIIFPRVAMCSFAKYGQSGALENREAVCVLPLNVLNEKLFLFLWFWYGGLLIAGVLTLCYRVVLVVHAPLRCQLLQLRFPDSGRLGALVSSVSVGDVFILGLIGQNVDALVFSQLVGELSRRVVKMPRAVAETGAQPAYRCAGNLA
ncbi:unnamed protein product [Ixodes hexagonus]